jgi:UDP-N-acetyl-D-glucosamine dehydrogenase
MKQVETLLQKIETREAVIGIIGLGYVGLPLAVEFAERGFHVVGLDVSASKVEKINQGESYIPDIPTARLQPLVKQGLLRATTEYAALATCDTISICVPTPLRKTKDPDMSYVIQAVESVSQITHEGMLIVLESTTYPGTTQEIVVPKISEGGLVVGENIFIAFSPERIDPGNKTFGVHNTPKVVGGVTPDCLRVVSALYGSIIARIVEVSSPTAAEMVKLLENTFRSVNIGMVNEMALMCDKLGVNVHEVITAASSKPFGFMPFYPGPGLGGHCIPIDPLYLSWKLKTLNYTARFIELASEVNASMPYYVVDKTTDALNDECKSVRGSKILVLGVAYKRDIDDVRESPALDVITLLHNKGAHVTYHDPYVPSIRLEEGESHGTMQSTPYDQAVEEADCVVIVTDHTVFDYQKLLNTAKLIVDTRHCTDKIKGTARVVRL